MPNPWTSAALARKPPATARKPPATGKGPPATPRPAERTASDQTPPDRRPYPGHLPSVTVQPNGALSGMLVKIHSLDADLVPPLLAYLAHLLNNRNA